MKILVGGLLCESNTFSDYRADISDFELYEGKETLQKIAASNVFESMNIEVIPTIYACCMPCIVKENTFLILEKKILDILKKHPDVDGIYLHLHGSMYVENLGSGEYEIVKAIRNLVGYNIPISLALDFHASIPEELLLEVNIINGYRTAPHVDIELTEIRAAKALLRCIREKILPRPVMVRVPILASDEFITTREPLFSFMQNMFILDFDDDVVSTAMFNSLPWMDLDYASPCIIVSRASGEAAALKDARSLAQKLWDQRHAIRRIDTFPVDMAVTIALKNDNDLLFVLDCGDNPHAGARGDGTVMLEKFLDAGGKNVLIAGVYNQEVTEHLWHKKIGDSFDEYITTTRVQGIVKGKGETLGQKFDVVGKGVLLNCGGVDLILTNTRVGFTSLRHMEAMGINPYDYKVIVVKLGYLWGELQSITSKHITASTPGQSTNNYRSLPFTKRDINVYPFVDNKQWHS